MFFTLPTILTWARIAAIPLLAGVFHLPLDDATRNLVATALFIAFALTDWLDGWLARKLNQVSSFGAFLDPVADKFLVCAALLILVEQDRVNALVALVIIGREIAISALREWMAQIGASRSVAVHMLGKVKTVTQMVAIPFLLYDGRLLLYIDTRVGHRADLRGRGADHLVDGVLPAQGALEIRAREMTSPQRRRMAACHAGGLLC
jgi:CDP-diacylglycerol--glycerol-3-phosphate 3-phosphatidyltransferase